MDQQAAHTTDEPSSPCCLTTAAQKIMHLHFVTQSVLSLFVYVICEMLNELMTHVPNALCMYLCKTKFWNKKMNKKNEWLQMFSNK